MLGRLASHTAALLRGKHKANFAPHVDTGDFVIIINADKIALTGAKAEQKRAYRHSGFPGGIKERTAKQILEGRFPERVIEAAVKRMMPRGPLGRQQMKNPRRQKSAEKKLEAELRIADDRHLDSGVLQCGFGQSSLARAFLQLLAGR